MKIGKALNWDDHDFALPIPGCTEKSLSERLDAEDRAKNLAPPNAPSPVASPQVKTVYVFPHEALHEFSNDTIHRSWRGGWRERIPSACATTPSGRPAPPAAIRRCSSWRFASALRPRRRREAARCAPAIRGLSRSDIGPGWARGG